MAGLAETRGPEGDNFWTWREVMYRFLDRLTPEEVEAIAALAYVEMLERGFTRVGEFHYLHHDSAGQPLRQCRGARGTHCRGRSRDGHWPDIASRVLRARRISAVPRRRMGSGAFSTARTASQSFSRRRSARSRLWKTPISAWRRTACARSTPEELARVVALAPSGPIHIHAAEQTKEVEDCIAATGARPVEWLLDQANVDKRWCLVHATHLTDDETKRLAASGAVAGLCPITEANLGDGIFPAAEYLQARGAFGLGTDSNILIDAAGELRSLEYAQRLKVRARNVLAPEAGHSTGRALFDGARAGGARALGLRISGLQKGASADFISLDAADPSFAARTGDALLDSWIFAGGSIDCVWRRGRKEVSQGRHRNGEIVRERYLRVITRLVR